VEMRHFMRGMVYRGIFVVAVGIGGSLSTLELGGVIKPLGCGWFAEVVATAGFFVRHNGSRRPPSDDERGSGK
jgi:hypothetical protein